MKGRDNIVVFFTILVIGKGLSVKGCFHKFNCYLIIAVLIFNSIVGGDFKIVEGRPRITTGIINNMVKSL